jgi:hypothetical protein
VNKTNTKTTPEGSQFVSADFGSIKTAAQWVKAFPARYSNLPAKIAQAFATRDMRAAK